MGAGTGGRAEAELELGEPMETKAEGRQRQMDGGRAWAVLLAAFGTFFIAFGLQVSFGVYFVEYKKTFGSSNARTAAVGSVSFGAMTIAGPLSNACYQLLGSRRSVMAGGALGSLGFVLAFFSQDITQLTLCYAVIGLGFGLTVTSLLAVQTEYFLRYRHFALAFVTVGSALGLFVFPPLLQTAIEELGWRGSMLINAGIVAQICVFGALMKSRRSGESRAKLSLRLLLPLDLFKDGAFVLFFANCTLWGLVSYAYFSLIVKFTESYGVPAHTAAYLVSLTGIGNTVGRVVASALNHVPGVNRPLFYAVSTLLLALGMLGTVGVGQTWGPALLPWALVTTAFGLGYGLMLPTIGTVILDLFGVERLGSAQGLISLGIGLGGLSVPGTVGLMADVESLDAAFLFGGAVGLLSAALAAALALLSLHRGRRLRLPHKAPHKPPPKPHSQSQAPLIDSNPSSS